VLDVLGSAPCELVAAWVFTATAVAMTVPMVRVITTHYTPPLSRGIPRDHDLLHDDRLGIRMGTELGASL